MPALTLPEALRIVGRYTPDLTTEERTDLLNEKAAVRKVGGVPVTLYDPYAAALADLYDPKRLKAQTQGGVSETYIDPESVAGYLRAESAALLASWPADEAATLTAINTELTLHGWGRRRR